MFRQRPIDVAVQRLVDRVVAVSHLHRAGAGTVQKVQANAQTKRFVVGTCFQEPDRTLQPMLVGQEIGNPLADNFNLRIGFGSVKNRVMIFGVKADVTMPGIEIVERFLHQPTVVASLTDRSVVLANVSGVITAASHHNGIRLLPRFGRDAGAGVEVDAVLSFELTQQDRNADWGADRTGDVRAIENTPLRAVGPSWAFGGFHSHRSPSCHTLIIGQNKDEVGAIVSPHGDANRDQQCDQHGDKEKRTNREPEGRPQHEEIVSWATRQNFYGRVPATSVPTAGRYRIRLRVQAIHPPADGRVWCSVQSGVCDAKASTMYWIGNFGATGDPMEYEFEAWIREGID